MALINMGTLCYIMDSKPSSYYIEKIDYILIASSGLDLHGRFSAKGDNF